MIRKIAIVLIVLLLSYSELLFAATAFSCPDPGLVKLNQTTRGEIETAYPFDSQTGSISVNGEIVETLTFTQISVRKSLAIARKVTPARALSFHFRDSILVGYEFVSSFKEDHTDFDVAKVSQIKMGETTIEGVKELLGNNCGEHRHPLVSGDAQRALVYGYSQVKGSFKLKIYQSVLVVMIDSSGVVIDVNLQTSGER